MCALSTGSTQQRTWTAHSICSRTKWMRQGSGAVTSVEECQSSTTKQTSNSQWIKSSYSQAPTTLFVSFKKISGSFFQYLGVFCVCQFFSVILVGVLGVILNLDSCSLYFAILFIASYIYFEISYFFLCCFHYALYRVCTVV